MPTPTTTTHAPANPSTVSAPALEIEDGELRDDDIFNPGSIFDDFLFQDNMDWNSLYTTTTVAIVPPPSPSTAIIPPHPAATVPPPLAAMVTAPPAAPTTRFYSLNDPVGYVPPRPPPLVPCEHAMIQGGHPFLKAGLPSISMPITDKSDSDTAPTKLLASLNLKRKMPMPEQSSDDMEVKDWFSPVTTLSSSSSWKRVGPSVMDAVEQVTDTSKLMFLAIQAMQEHKVRDRVAKRDLKQWVHQEKHADNKMSCEHECEMQMRQMQHKQSMAQNEL